MRHLYNVISVQEKEIREKEGKKKKRGKRKKEEEQRESNKAGLEEKMF